MDFVPGPVLCAVCGRVPNRDDFLEFCDCIVCGDLFCPDHLINRKGVQTCEACVAEREEWERMSGASDDDEARVVSLLRADVIATLGSGYDGTIVESAARQRLFVDADRYASAVIEDVQQFFHDSYVDTSWPACPLHPNHPLWFYDGCWHCQQTKTRIAALGALSTVTRSE